MGEPELLGEAFGTTERFGREGGQVVHMLGLARSEERLEKRILEDAAVERVFKAVEHLLATDELVEGRHGQIVRGHPDPQKGSDVPSPVTAFLGSPPDTALSMPKWGLGQRD